MLGLAIILTLKSLFSLFSPDRAMVEDTDTVCEIQHNLSCTLSNYLLSDQFPATRQKVSFHVSFIVNYFFTNVMVLNMNSTVKMTESSFCDIRFYFDYRVLLIRMDNI